ncbi:MAG: hypothetical protein K1X35_14465, partial [Caulobacteraceae bacterium]|nr:hypothetical protein [Caulobacteraceae bacterium]
MAGDDRLFSLTDNPFALTGLTPRSSREQIEAAGRGSGWAAGVLLDPYQRLTEEVAWLPGASGQAAQEAVAALGARDEARVREAIVLLRGLAKANISADAALRFGDVELVDQLARAWEAVDPAEVLAQVNADRMISGFPQTNAAQVDWALQSVRSRHAGAAARVLAAAGPEGRDRLARLVERPSTSGQTADLKLIEALVAAYGEEQAGELDRLEAAILDETDAMVRGGRDATDRLEMLFDGWQAQNRPALLLARLKGRDDARALALVGDMRVRYLDPSRGEARIGPAARIAQALMSRFADSPLVLRMVSADAARLGAGGLPAPAPAAATPAPPQPEAERTHRQAARQARRDAQQPA